MTLPELDSARFVRLFWLAVAGAFAGGFVLSGSLIALAFWWLL